MATKRKTATKRQPVRNQRRTAVAKPGKSGSKADEAAVEHFLWTIGGSDYSERYELPFSEEKALTLSAVWACTTLIAEALSVAGWHVFETKENGGKNKLDKDPIAWLINTQPNPEMDAFQFRFAMYLWALLCGNAYAEIEVNGRGEPHWLWWIDSDRVCPKRDALGMYYLVDEKKPTEVIIRPERMLHLKGPSPDGLVGYDTIKFAAKTIKLALSQEGYGQAYFGRGVMASGILDIPGNVRKEDRDEMRKTFEKMHGGQKNAGSVIPVSGGVKFTPMQLQNDSSRYNEARTFQIEDVCRFWKVPPYKLGIMSKTSYASQEQSAIEYVQQCLLPWAVRLEKEADIKLFGPINRGKKWTKLNLAVFLRGDSATQTANLASQIQTAMRTPNEAREELDLNPNPDGDKLMIQGATIPLERALEEPEPPPAPTPPQEPDDNAQPPAEPAQDAENRAQVTRVFGKLFAESFQRLLRIEADKARRASTKDELKPHATAFYGSTNISHVADNVQSIISALAVTTGKADAMVGKTAYAIGTELDSESYKLLEKHGVNCLDSELWTGRPARMAARAVAICLEMLK